MRIKLWDDTRKLSSVCAYRVVPGAEQLIPLGDASNALRLRFEVNTLAHECGNRSSVNVRKRRLAVFVGLSGRTTLIKECSQAYALRIERMRRRIRRRTAEQACALRGRSGTGIFDVWRAPAA